MPRLSLHIAAVAALALGLVLAAPASAAVSGTLCGQVTAFTAPTATTDGSITINGTTEVIDSSAAGAIAATTQAALTAAANVDASTCLEITANSAGEIVDLDVAAQASVELCGDLVLQADGDAVIDGTVVPAALISADARAVLVAAASANADVCANLDATTVNGATTVTVSVTANVCLEVTAITDTSLSAGGATFTHDGTLDASVSVGDEVCLTLSDGPSGPAFAVLGAGGSGPGAGGPLLPDTATGVDPAPIWLAFIAAGAIVTLLRVEATRRH